MSKEKVMFCIQFLTDSSESDGPKAGDYFKRGGIVQKFKSIQDAERTWDSYFRHNFGICNIEVYSPEIGQ